MKLLIMLFGKCMFEQAIALLDKKYINILD